MDTTQPAIWQLYLLRTAKGALYTGITTDIARRFRQHQRGKGAKALLGKGPLELLFYCTAGNRAAALRLEYRVKQLTRQQKLQLIADKPTSLTQWFSQNG